MKFPITALLLSAPFFTFDAVHAAPASLGSGYFLAGGKNAVTKATPVSQLNGVREYVLSNGMKVLLKETRNAPVVYFSVWYKVGSVNEQLGQTGMSHLLEHIMFKGTKKRKPGEISATLQQNGAQFNATTSFDRTNYYEAVASDRLELAMELEADRMNNSVFDAREHAKEMTVVRSEYEGGENNPGSTLTKAVRLSAFQVHPYRWTPIGFRSDIENISRDEMFAYYKNYYAPNNATLVLVGDFNTQNALNMAQKYFGKIPARKIAQRFITPEPEQQGERRVTVRRAGTTRQVQIVHHIPAYDHPDRYALDVLESVLSGGRSARFFTKLVQSGLASSANAYDYGLRDPDLVFLDAAAQPGKTNEELEKALLAEVERLKNEPIEADELKRILQQAEAQYIFGQDSVQAQGSQLGEYAMRGDWKFGENYLANLRKVTPDDVQRVARKYFVSSNRTVGYFEPIAAGQTQAKNESVAPKTAAAKLETRTNALQSPALQTTFKTVVAQTAPIAAPVQSTRMVLPNGLTLIVQSNRSNPTVSLSGALLSAGNLFDPQDKPGLAAFTASQLSRGTQTRSLLDIARALENVGASASVGGGEEYATVGGRSLTRDFNLVLELLADQLRRPNFPADELEKARAQLLAGLEEAKQDTGTLARIAFMNALYPVGHPYHAATVEEQIASVKAMSRDDLVRFHQSHYAPERLVLTIVGDIDAPTARTMVEKYFGDWARNPNAPLPTIPDTTIATTDVKRQVIQVPDKTQADVIYGYAGGLKRSDPEFYRVVVLNTILGGGALSSRLGTSVRDKLGLVYGIYAGTDASLGAGPFTVNFGTNPKNIEQAIGETQRQISQAREKGFTPKEVADTISYLTGSYAVTLSTNAAVAGQLLVGEVYGLGNDYIQKRNSYYRAVTPSQVNEAARKYLQPGKGALVIAGTIPETTTPAIP